MPENLVSYFQVKDGSFELIIEDFESEKVISVARYPLEILAMELKPYMTETNEPTNTQFYVDLIKDNFFGVEFAIGYNLCKVNVVHIDYDDDGYSWKYATTESGKTVKLKSLLVFKNEDLARFAANELLENNRKLFITLYQKLMKNLETIDKTIMSSPIYIDEPKS
jgi:hypothetical protein